MNDDSKAQDLLFAPATVPVTLDDSVTTFSMVPVWVRGTAEYQAEFKRLCLYYSNDLNPRLWRRPKPTHEAMQAMAGVTAMKAVGKKLEAKGKAVTTQAGLLESSLQAIETVCA